MRTKKQIRHSTVKRVRAALKRFLDLPGKISGGRLNVHGYGHGIGKNSFALKEKDE